MKIQTILTSALFSATMLLCAEPVSNDRFENLPSAPLDAKGGMVRDGVQIGLWTEKESYTGNEIRNVWLFARKEMGSPYRIGVDGNIYKESIFYITDSEGKVTKFPIGGAIDGMVDPVQYFGGISGLLEKLPPGRYELVWKTEKFESNRIKINIKEPPPAADQIEHGKQSGPESEFNLNASSTSIRRKGGSGKGPGSGTSKLADLSILKKDAELDAPVAVRIVSLGRKVEGLESIKERIVDVKITNPNPYAVFFRGRQYRDNKTIKPRWNALKDGVWTEAGWDWCERGARDWIVEPGGEIEVMLYLHSELKEQQILGRFYRVDNSSVQSDCLLYEKE